MVRLIPIGLIAAALTAVSSGAAQQGFHTHSFTPFPEITVSGTVESVDHTGSDVCEACLACSDCDGTHLVVSRRGARIEIHLAPAWFLERNGYVFTVGDEVSIVGTRTMIRGDRGLLAREVRRGTQVMKFRDEHGLPLWRRELTD